MVKNGRKWSNWVKMAKNVQKWPNMVKMVDFLVLDGLARWIGAMDWRDGLARWIGTTFETPQRGDLFHPQN